MYYKSERMLYLPVMPETWEISFCMIYVRQFMLFLMMIDLMNDCSDLYDVNNVVS